MPEVIVLNFKIGDMVERKSYSRDLMFIIDRIISTEEGENIAILKGLDKRIEADSPLHDLEFADRCLAKRKIARIDNRLDERAEEYLRKTTRTRWASPYMRTGKILHLDGDRKYSEKSTAYYKKLGLNAIVRNIPESRQPQVVVPMLTRYKPDILVMTGHDAILKKGRSYNYLYNYRNSKYFVKAVQEARKWGEDPSKLVIFARSMSKFF